MRTRSALVADAQPDFRRQVRHLLEGIVGRIDDAATRSEALQHVREHEPDLILLDVLLDGPALAREIKIECPASRVVLVTGHGEEAYLSATGKTGSDAVLPKAQLRARLVPLVTSLLRGTPLPWDGWERRIRSSESWRGPERRSSRQGGR